MRMTSLRSGVVPPRSACSLRSQVICPFGNGVLEGVPCPFVFVVVVAVRVRQSDRQVQDTFTQREVFAELRRRRLSAFDPFRVTRAETSSTVSRPIAAVNFAVGGFGHVFFASRIKSRSFCFSSTC